MRTAFPVCNSWHWPPATESSGSTRHRLPRLGGMIAQEIALHYPQRVASLTLVCTMATTSDPAVLTEVPAAAHLVMLESADAFNRAVLGFLGAHLTAGA